jgi:hypothetical protein
MVGEVDAIERCAYCRNYVPVTRIEMEVSEEETYIRANVDVCENCLDDYR